MSGAHKEYLRRNLLHASAIGCGANIAAALARLRKMKRAPKWLVELLDRTLIRANDVAPEMAKWRNAAPDAPAPLSKSPPTKGMHLSPIKIDESAVVRLTKSQKG